MALLITAISEMRFFIYIYIYTCKIFFLALGISLYDYEIEDQSDR